uniref:Cytochrome P450 n=1 Tax=Musca domestica TaxID=7370 RepID=A0A1I8M618_MUSDO
MFKLPGRIGYPLLGIALDLTGTKKDPLEVMNDINVKYGSVALTWLLHYPLFIVTDPDIIRDILMSPHCINKSKVYRPFKKAIGVGLLSSGNPEWSVHRKHLNPTFSHKILLSFIPVFNEEVNKLLEQFQQMDECPDVISVLQEFTLTTGLRTTMGIEASERAISARLKANFNVLAKGLIQMVFSPWLAHDLIRKLYGIYEPFNTHRKDNEKIIQNLIKKKLDKANSGSKIFIDQAVELLRKDIFSMQEVEDESNTMVVGALETTTNTIGYGLMLLAMFPEYQERAYEELLAMFPEGGAFDVTYANIQDMAYLDLIVNETMRLMAPGPLVARENTQDLQLSNGLVLPAGVQCVINMFALHRRKDIWGPDADKFNPDHFLPSNIEDKHPFAFIPFTKGVRSCIGRKYGLMSTKITLAKLLRNFKFSTDFKFEDLEYCDTLVLTLKRVPALKIEKRQKIH